MKFLFAANCNLQQILSAFLEIENACAHNLWQVAEKVTLQLKLVATHCLLLVEERLEIIKTIPFAKSHEFAKFLTSESGLL